jgi:hypothetical protein
VGKGTNAAGSNVAIGLNATAITFGHCQAYGRSATATAANQVTFGSTISPVTDFRLGVNLKGACLSVKSSTEVVNTGSLATQSTTNLIPAGATLLAITARVGTAITTSGGADTWSLGDSTDADRYALDAAGALHTVVDADDYTADPAGVWSASARDVILSAPGVETFNGGAARIVAHYTIPTAPTSSG